MEKIVELMNNYKANHTRCKGVSVTTYLNGYHDLKIATLQRIDTRCFENTEQLIKFLSK